MSAEDANRKTLAERSQCAIDHPDERQALVLLHRAGWTTAELSMTFQASENAIRRTIAAETVEVDP